MKVIAVGDPHFKETNVIEVEMFIEKIVGLCKEEKPDFIVILGDVLDEHERLHTQALNKACEFIDKMRLCAPTYVLVGNHDMIRNSEFLTENHWMNPLKEWENVVIVDKVIHIEEKEYKFILSPYVPPSRFMEALATLGELYKNATCIFAHQEFRGCKMGAIISTEGDVWDEKDPAVVSGHIHDRQFPQENIYYCGSSMQHSFGETSTHIIPILTWSSPSVDYKLKEVDLNLPKKKTIYVDETSLQNLNVDDLVDGLNKIKLSVDITKEQFKSFKKTSKYKQLVKSGIKVLLNPSAKKYDCLERLKLTDAEKTEMQQKDFPSLLEQLILAENNTGLYEIYEKLLINQ